MDGTIGPAAQSALAFCADITDELTTRGKTIPIRLLDERLTTVQAHQALHRSGRAGRKHRSVVDQVAAVLILQSALDRTSATGRPAGDPFPLPPPA